MHVPLLADAFPWLADHAVAIVGTLIVVVGLVGLGLADLVRFSPRRIWAISGVCFAESVRRKVLWIIPVAILGLVAVVQLQQPTDEQDAIRQTTKFCLFGSGLVVVLSTLILACTNLPREIENRVIFTVVTKPTTRLEIVLGKVVGFARVSATILVIMGLFTWGYLHLRAWSLTGDLERRLKDHQVEAISVPTFQHYVDAGLLNAKTLVDPAAMNIYGRAASPDGRRLYLDAEGYMLAPFAVPPDMAAAADPDGQQYKGPGMVILLRVGYDPVAPATRPAGAPPLSAAATAAAAGPPRVAVQVFDENADSLLTGQQLAVGPVPLATPDGRTVYPVTVPASLMPLVAKHAFVYVALSTGGGNGRLWVDNDPASPPVQLVVPVTSKADPLHLNPADPADLSRPGRMVFAGRQGTYGQQVTGDPSGQSQVCVYSFQGLHVDPAAATVPVEMRVGIEKNGDVAEDVPTELALSVTDRKTGRSAAVPGRFQPENNRPLYAALPADLVRSGDFDVSVRCLTPDQWVGFKPTSLSLVRSESSFGINLGKSLFVLWLLSVLVTTISVFCSTFLSWPIAVVLTLVILFGRWGVDELGDAASAGLGRQFVSDFRITDVATSTALSASVEKLNQLLKTVSAALPDVSAFAATDDIDRGISIPARTLADAAKVLLGFGLPLTVLAYVFLKNKEVAP